MRFELVLSTEGLNITIFSSSSPTGSGVTLPDQDGAYILVPDRWSGIPHGPGSGR